ncbi:hypothetical protein B0H14DRAFT_1364668 [Mycena olivaceomarginata]|nr:hypothetical protein B0H14DRAFT_1364668 [Mycena olivaceomarginata]
MKHSPLSNISENTSWQTTSTFRVHHPLPRPPVDSENLRPLLELGDARLGTRAVRCPQCHQYINHGYDSGPTPMTHHLAGTKCRPASDSMITALMPTSFRCPSVALTATSRGQIKFHDPEIKRLLGAGSTSTYSHRPGGCLIVLSSFSLRMQGSTTVRRPASQCALPNALTRGPFAYPRPYIPVLASARARTAAARFGAEQQDVCTTPLAQRSPRGRRGGGSVCGGSAAILSLCICVRCAVGRFEGECIGRIPALKDVVAGALPPVRIPFLRRGLDAVGGGRGTVHPRCCSIAPPP